MKRIIYAAVMVAVFLSCSRDDGNRVSESSCDEDGGSLVLNLEGFVGTKSEHPSWEKSLKSIDVLFFRPDGSLYRHRSFSGVDAFSKVSVKNIKEGSYRMAVVANAPADMNLKALYDIDELFDERAFTLAGVRAGSCLPMMTSRDFSDSLISVFDDKTTEITAVVQRPVARVSLTSVFNALPVSLKLQSVMLTNVADSTLLDGTTLKWSNRQGRADEPKRMFTHIIDGVTYKATASDLTFHPIDREIYSWKEYSIPWHMYGYPNASVNNPSGFTETYPADGEKTCLVVTASIQDHTYYYPVVLDSLDANTSYDVSLIVTGRGSDDPNTPVKTDWLSVTVAVKPWGVNHDYTDEI